VAINVIQGGTVNSFDYLAFPNQNPVNAAYIQNQLSNFSDTLTEYGRSFIEASREIYNKVNDSHAMALAKAAIRRAKSILHPNQVVYLGTLEDIQNAQPVMQRFVMAQPDLRRKYHKQLVDGYSDTYVDLHPGKVENDHYDYRRVTSGIIMETENEEGESGFTVRIHAEDLITGDVDLSFDEKHDIMRTWDVVQMFLDASKDPSNPFEK
jgi:hypothetical protein